MIKKIDRRIYLSIISNIKKTWVGGGENEYLAMDYMADWIYRELLVLDAKKEKKHD